MITWVFYEKMLGRKMSANGACNGAVVGLVAITPAAGFVNIGQSTFIGFVAAMVQAYHYARSILGRTPYKIANQ